MRNFQLLIISAVKTVNNVCKLLQLLGDPQRPRPRLRPWSHRDFRTPELLGAITLEIKIPGDATEHSQDLPPDRKSRRFRQHHDFNLRPAVTDIIVEIRRVDNSADRIRETARDERPTHTTVRSCLDGKFVVRARRRVGSI